MQQTESSNILSLVWKISKLSLEKNPDTVFEQLIEYTSHSLVSILKAYQVLPVDNRIKLNEVCSKYRGESLFTGLITPNDKEKAQNRCLKAIGFSDVEIEYFRSN